MGFLLLLMLKELIPESPEEKLRIEFQTELQNTVHKFVTAGVEPPIVLQEVSRLVGDVLYRICHANGWLYNDQRLTELANATSHELSFAFKTLREANPEAKPTTAGPEHTRH